MVVDGGEGDEDDEDRSMVVEDAAVVGFDVAVVTFLNEIPEFLIGLHTVDLILAS